MRNVQVFLHIATRKNGHEMRMFQVIRPSQKPKLRSSISCYRARLTVSDQEAVGGISS